MIKLRCEQFGTLRAGDRNHDTVPEVPGDVLLLVRGVLCAAGGALPERVLCRRGSRVKIGRVGCECAGTQAKIVRARLNRCCGGGVRVIQLERIRRRSSTFKSLHPQLTLPSAHKYKTDITYQSFAKVHSAESRQQIQLSRRKDKISSILHLDL